MAKIAIIGSGISGLGAAYLLNKRHDITVYEKTAHVGGHSHTVALDYDRAQIPVDIGFIVFNEQNYPHLSALFRHLGVPTRKSDMSFAASIGGGAFEWGAENLNTVIGQRRNLLRPMFWRLLSDVTRFNRDAAGAVAAHPEWTLDDLMRALKLSEDFARLYFLPMTAAIWSCPPAKMRAFPARPLVQFFRNHNLMSVSGQPQWYTVTGGACEYVKRLTAPFAHRIRASTAVAAVTRYAGGVQIADAGGGREVYDEVIFACHGDEILPLLADANPRERAVLSAFRFQPNRIVLHKDASVMPQRRRCWAAWNYRSDGTAAEAALSVTYWMNRLQGIRADRPLFVTLNPSSPIAAEDTFLTQEFSHPVFDHGALAAQPRLAALQGERRTWFCGAWMRHGFHEDGLASAVAVAERLGARVPWQAGRAEPPAPAGVDTAVPEPALAAE